MLLGPFRTFLLLLVVITPRSVLADVPPPGSVVPNQIRLTITGDPASPEFLTDRINAAVTQALAASVGPGPRVRPLIIWPTPQSLASGFLTDYTVPLISDPATGTPELAGSIHIEIRNVDLARFLPSTLAFRDDPERITADGVLSRTLVDTAHPTRLYYYHENGRQQRRFCVVLSANGSVLSHVQIIGAAAGPNIDVMSVGHAATKTFLARQPRNEGSVESIIGGKPILERDTLVEAGDGIVGSIDLRVIDGGPVTATVMAIPRDAQPASYFYAAKLPDDGHARHGTFDLRGFAQRIIGYSAGGPDAAYAYGSRRQTLSNNDPADRGRDYGDYGVLQRVTFDLANGTSQPATFYLYVRPLGGDVRSSFVVNGQAIELGCVRLPRHYLVDRYELRPHATGALDVLTMTDGGSNYPVELGVTITPPIPVAPPISAPDGCFPKPATVPR